jgi:hypothetical protein
VTNHFAKPERKEVNEMENKYEAPELTLVGSAAEIVMGLGAGGSDLGMQAAPDFEFEQD